MPEHPDWIPYRTSYYRPNWGFCVRHRDFLALTEDRYEVCIDSTLAPGNLTYAECYIPGASEHEVLIFAHVCHPSLANDNASGIAVATELARCLHESPGRLSYRFVFSPGTIGAITWLSQNERRLGRIAHGLVLGLTGDPGPITYKCSVEGNVEVDRAAAYVLASLGLTHRIEPFSPYGYDERQFCSPGINLPVGRLTRSPNDGYPEYHSSADDLSLVGSSYLGESIYACSRILATLDGNGTYRNMSPKCEPQLGKRGLYRPTGGQGPGEFEHALLWVLNQSTGKRSLLDVAERSGISFAVIRSAADELLKVGLLQDMDSEADSS
jgi:aminopeptidase-like protein